MKIPRTKFNWTVQGKKNLNKKLIKKDIIREDEWVALE